MTNDRRQESSPLARPGEICSSPRVPNPVAFSARGRGPSTGHLFQLDGLRGLAIVAIALHHFGFHPPSWIDWGPVGPSIFFLLSGYLITLSLWKIQASRHEVGGSLVPQLAEFHARRICRLLPPIIVLLVVGAFTGLPEYRETWAWSLTFTTNILLVLQNDWVGSLSHFWSISLQEQFYLLWPLILLVPRALFPQAMVAAILLAAGFRLACIIGGVPTFARWFFLPGSLDTFAAGGLVAWLVVHGQAGILQAPRWRIPLFLSALAALAFSRYLRFLPDSHPGTAAVEFFESIFFVWLLLCLTAAPESRIARALSCRPLVFVGTVSYGIFIFHSLVGILTLNILAFMGTSDALPGLAKIVLCLLASIAVATASYHFLERPINQAVRRYDFSQPFSFPRPIRLARWLAEASDKTAGRGPVMGGVAAAILGAVILSPSQMPVQEALAPLLDAPSVPPETLPAPENPPDSFEVGNGDEPPENSIF